MKKTLIALLITLLVITGCGKKTENDDPTANEDNKDKETLVIYGLKSGYGTKGWEKVIEGFEKSHDVEVELVMEKNIEEILRPKIQADEIPDLIYLAVGSTGGLTDTMISENNIEEITDVLDMEVPGESVKVKDKVLPGFFESLRTSPYADGKVYLSPLFYSPLGLFYNAGLFEEKGWDVPETWDEMWALGDKAKEEGIALFTYPTTGYFDGFFSSLLNATVGPEAYEKLMTYDLDTWKDPKTKEAFEIVGKLASYTHEDTVSQANAESFTKNQQLILNNKALFIPNGTWLPEEMEEAPREDNFAWGMTAVPKVDASSDAYASTFSEEIYIPKGAKNVDTAKKFLAYLYTDEAAKAFFDNAGAVQPIEGSEKLIPSGDEKEVFYNIYKDGAHANSVGFASHEPVEGYDVVDILYSTVDAVVTGQKSVDGWYEEVIEAIEKYN